MLTPGSLIQGKFGPSGNFEALLYRAGTIRLTPRSPVQSGKVFHYWREEMRADQGWNRGAEVLSGAIGPGCLIQSAAGHLEAIIPATNDLRHYRMDTHTLKWGLVARIISGRFAGAAICENRASGNLEVVALRANTLTHYRYINGVWQAGKTITTHATGLPSLIQNRGNQNLEVLTLEGRRVALYFFDERRPEKTWLPGGVVTENATGAASLVQADFGPENHRNLEAVVPEGDVLRHYWRDHSKPNLPWMRGVVITWGREPILSAALAVSNLKGGCLDVLLQEGENSLYHYFRVGRTPQEMRWLRGPCLRVEEGAIIHRGTSERITQLTGQKDFVTGRAKADASKHGIRGTDLGASFKHGGRLYFLFGDTHWTDNRAGGTRDMIAYTDETSAKNGLTLRFARNCTSIVSPIRIPQEEYDVPLDGFSHGGAMYVFFTTDHFNNRRVMGRSILTRCTRPDPGFDISETYKLVGNFVPTTVKFDFLGNVSTGSFINISNVLVGRAEITRWKLPAVNRALLLWGSGAYRADTITLACLPLDGAAPDLNQIRYFTGAPNGTPHWSNPGLQNEGQAVPLFYPAAVGELSVRWDATLQRFVLLYCPGPEDSAGLAVTMRVSTTPWGPWSNRRKILDWWEEAMEKFIHRGGANDGLHQGDTPFPRGPKQGGAAYAPYQVADFTTVQGDIFTLYYVLSTWNPYQAVLMRHTLTRAELNQMQGSRILFDNKTKKKL